MNKRTRTARSRHLPVGSCVAVLPDGRFWSRVRGPTGRRYGIGVYDTREAAEHAIRAHKHPPFVYFVEDTSTGLIKIGFATNLKERLSNMQVGNPSRLLLLSVRKGSRGDEAKLHLRFRHLRENGEWFRPGPELMQYLRLDKEDAA